MISQIYEVGVHEGVLEGCESGKRVYAGWLVHRKRNHDCTTAHV